MTKSVSEDSQHELKKDNVQQTKQGILIYALMNAHDEDQGGNLMEHFHVFKPQHPSQNMQEEDDYDKPQQDLTPNQQQAD